MKKLFLLFCVCCWGYAAFAQLPINIGIHGGTSSNRIKVKDIPNALGTQAHTGYMIGAFGRINLGKIYIEPALNYAHRESVLEFRDNQILATRETRNLKVNSFDIPIMLGFEVLDLSIAKLRAFLGPVVSFSKLKDIKEITDLDSKNTNWHGKIGIGVDIWKLTFDIDYEKAFQELGHELKAPRSFNFTLGLKII